MAMLSHPAGVIVRACRAFPAAGRSGLAAGTAAVLATSIGITACGPDPAYPVQAAYTPAGPYATATGVVKDSAGTVIDDLFYPANYAALGFKSPIVTWGNGTGSQPQNYSTLLSHFASSGSP